MTCAVKCQRTNSQMAIGMPIDEEVEDDDDERRRYERGAERLHASTAGAQGAAASGRTPARSPTIQATAAETIWKARTLNSALMIEAMTKRPAVPSVSETSMRSPTTGSRVDDRSRQQRQHGDRDGDRADSGERAGVPAIEHAGDAEDLARLAVGAATASVRRFRHDVRRSRKTASAAIRPIDEQHPRR